MGPARTPVKLIAAILCDIVYHTQHENVLPPHGWERIASAHEPRNGSLTEAWGDKTETANHYRRVMIVNRGTVFGRPDGATCDPTVPIAHAFRSDMSRTVFANAAIIFGRRSSYLDTAVVFFERIRKMHPNTPLIVIGQSLGGAAANHVGLHAQKMGYPCKVLTFNALPYCPPTKLFSAADVESSKHNINNYRVTNDRLTRNFLLNRVVRWFGGTIAGHDILLPALPNCKTFLDAHLPTGAVGAIVNLIPVAARANVLDIVGGCYPNEATRPRTLSTFFVPALPA